MITIHLHTVFRWGAKIINSYQLPSTDLERVLNEPQSKDVYYRECFKVERLSNEEALKMNKEAQR